MDVDISELIRRVNATEPGTYSTLGHQEHQAGWLHQLDRKGEEGPLVVAAQLATAGLVRRLGLAIPDLWSVKPAGPRKLKCCLMKRRCRVDGLVGQSPRRLRPVGRAKPRSESGFCRAFGPTERHRGEVGIADTGTFGLKAKKLRVTQIFPR